MSSVPLAESSSATADASGIATVTLGPLRSFETWLVSRLAVSSTSQTLIPTAKVYRGSVTPSRLIDGTYTGTLDATSDPIELGSGDKVVVQWTGADVGATCTATVEGKSVR